MKLFKWLVARVKTVYTALFVRCYRTVTVRELPDNVEKGHLYLIGENGKHWFAALICPCGCSELIQISLLQNERPHWKVNVSSKQIPSLHPSIWRKNGCQSHFVLRNGRILWTRSSSPTTTRGN